MRKTECERPRIIANTLDARACRVVKETGGVVMAENDMDASLGKGSAIAKVCAILKSLSEKSPQRLNALADRTNLNRATAFRILEELAVAGFVVKRGQPPGYAFGPECLAMAAAASRSLNVRTAARPSLLQLAHLSGDTVLLTVRSGSDAVCLDRVVGEYPISANRLNVGNRVPLGISAGSMALLAFLPDAERTAVLEITCSRLSAFPRFNRKKLQKYIQDACDRGIVTMYDIIVDNLGAIALPLRDQSGNVFAALSIASLSTRLWEREAELVSMMKTEAKAIANALWRS